MQEIIPLRAVIPQATIGLNLVPRIPPELVTALVSRHNSFPYRKCTACRSFYTSESSCQVILHNRFASLGIAIGPGLAELDGMDYPGIPLRVKHLAVYNETLIYLLGILL